MLNRFAFRALYAPDKDAGGVAADTPIGQWPDMGKKKTASKPYVLKRGGKDEEILSLLKTFKGEKTLEELAAMLGKRGGGSMEPNSLRARISVITGFLEEKGISPGKIAAIMPKNYGVGQRGRQAKPAATTESLAEFFDDVEEVETDDEADVSDLA